MKNGTNKLLLAFALCVISLYSQAKIADADPIWHDSLNTAKDVSYLTDLEKEVIFEMNKARSNPKAYLSYLIAEKEYYKGTMREKPNERPRITIEGVSALDECIAYMQTCPAVGILTPNEGLHRAALDHALDQSNTGQTGHYGSDGCTMTDRIARYHQPNMWRAENISYGRNDAREIVFQLLVDDNVPSRGHRESLLKAVYSECGVAIESHPIYEELCVIVYARIYTPDRDAEWNE